MVKDRMKKSKLLSIVLANALVLSNIACACAASAMAASDYDPGATEHHHAASSDVTGAMPCAHHDCEGCEDLQADCAAPDFIVASAERDNRATLLAQIDFDSSDLEFAYSGTDPPSFYSPYQQTLLWGSAAAALPLDTPVLRNDQLIE
jgi:hypothetical protein